jgi:hypothetical protein
VFRLQQVAGDMLKILVADAVIVEPVSTPKFPANRDINRDINREFRQIRSLCEILNADTRAISKAFSQIPYKTEQGIISAEQGILTQEQEILPIKSEIIIG